MREQGAVALRPDNPKLLTATAPVNPAQLKKSVTASLNAVFLALAGVALIIGAVGIANTTLVAVLERSSEIGLRRALGARPRHIAIQFLAESTALGLFGGLVGACLGVLVAIGVTISEHWTALLDAAHRLRRSCRRRGDRAAGRPVPVAAREHHRARRCAAPLTALSQSCLVSRWAGRSPPAC